MSEAEKDHIVDATHFELGKLERDAIRERVVYELFNNVDHDLAVRAAEGIGIEPPEEPGAMLPDHDRESPALSRENTVKDTIETRRIAILVADGFDDEQFGEVKSNLEERGAQVEVISKLLGERASAEGTTVAADKSHVTTGSIMYDAVFVPGGRDSVDALLQQGDAKHFVAEAFKHKKPIGALGEGIELLEAMELPDLGISEEGGALVSEQGVVTDAGADDLDSFFDAFESAIAEHRHWERSETSVPA